MGLLNNNILFVFKLSLVADDLTELAGTIAGPPDTPYEGGTYRLEIKIPDTYPFNPPRVRFITKVRNSRHYYSSVFTPAKWWGRPRLYREIIQIN